MLEIRYCTEKYLSVLPIANYAVCIFIWGLKNKHKKICKNVNILNIWDTSISIFAINLKYLRVKTTQKSIAFHLFLHWYILSSFRGKRTSFFVNENLCLYWFSFNLHSSFSILGKANAFMHMKVGRASWAQSIALSLNPHDHWCFYSSPLCPFIFVPNGFAHWATLECIDSLVRFGSKDFDKEICVLMVKHLEYFIAMWFFSEIFIFYVNFMHYWKF